MRFIKSVCIGVVFILIGIADISTAQQPSQYALLREPVFKTPLIWKLTKQVANTYWGVDLFYRPRSMAQSYIISPSLEYYTAVGFLVDQYWDRIVYTEALDNWIRAYGTHGAGAGKFLWPRSIAALAPCDETYYSYYYYMYIADSENNRIAKLKYDWRTNNQTVSYEGEISGGDLDRPKDLDLHDNGDFWPGTNDYLWVMDWEGRIKRYTTDGVLHNTYGDTGCTSQAGQFCNPTAVACGRNPFLAPPYDQAANDNDIYVADNGNHRIVRLQKASGGEEISWTWATPVDMDISDLEVDNWGQVWASDRSTGRIVKYTKDLFPLCTFGDQGAGANQFIEPTSISCTGGYLGCGNVFIGEAWTDSTGGQYYSIGTDVVDYYVTSSPNERWQYIHYVLVDPSITIVKIMNLQNQFIRTLFHGLQNSGENCFIWDGADDSNVQVPSGYYYISIWDTCTYTDTETGAPSNNVTKGAWVFHEYNPTGTYIPGDVNNDGTVNIGDAVYLLNYIFRNGPPPSPELCVGEVNGDGKINVGDAVYIINFVFKGGSVPQNGCL